MKFALLAVVLVLGTAWLNLAGAQPANPANPADALTPLTRAHAHNDYEHERPLWDALDQGFCSVEADVHLVGGDLLVAHDRVEVRPERTLRALYLDPLRHRVEANRGRVYRDGPPVLLLIDIKSEADATYRVLREQLQAYAGMLTVFTHPICETARAWHSFCRTNSARTDLELN